MATATQEAIRVKLAELVLDFDLYLRGELDSHRLATMTEAVQAGEELPPILIDERTRQVIDGFHRVKVQRRMLGDNGEIWAIPKQYANDQERHLEATRCNATHGKPLSSLDRARAVLLADRLKIPDEKMAVALAIRVDKVAEIRVRKLATAGKLPVLLKSTIGHLAGRQLNKRQARANKQLSGMRPQFYVNQVILLLENDLVNRDDQQVMKRLQKLQTSLGKFLKK